MLLECVPNVSLGPQDEALDTVLAGLRAATSPGCALLDVHTDPDHRRTVLTLAGAPAPLVDVVTELADLLAEHASLVDHEGVHPRVGMLDVVPFVALDAPRSEAHRAGHALAGRLATRDVPTYGYAELSPTARSRDLVEIRRAFEGARPGQPVPLGPDRGPDELHPSMGAACVGVRDPLVAYNVLLATEDLSIGRAIAARIRASSGGLPGLQALAFPLESQGGRVQVSTNVTDVSRLGLGEVYEAVSREAEAEGVEVREGELVGLAPRQALPKNPSDGAVEPDAMSLEDALATAGLSVDEVL